MKVFTTAIRQGVTLILLYGIYRETGACTVIAFTLFFVTLEIVGPTLGRMVGREWATRRITKRILKHINEQVN